MTRRSLAAALTLAFVAACGSGTSPIGFATELATARARWAEHGPASYDITVIRSCECTAEMTGPVIVSVRNGVVESRRYVATGASVPAGLAGEFGSVEEAFALIETLRAQRLAKLEVSYDHATGFPTRVYVDYDATMVDDERLYTMKDLTAR